MIDVKRAVQLVRDFAALDNAKLEAVELSEDDSHWIVILGAAYNERNIASLFHIFTVNTETEMISKGDVVTAADFIHIDTSRL